MRSRVGLAIVALVAIMAATGCSPSVRWRNAPADQPGSAGSVGPGGVTSGTISWRDCDQQARGINNSLPRSLNFTCATVTVPRDWTTARNGVSADGKTFQISLMRAHSSHQATRKGSILMDPGGPGGSGVEFIAYVAPRMTGLLTSFDLIGFDPRGVGRSSPVECITDADLDSTFGFDPDPDSATEYQGAVDLAKRVAAGCTGRYGADLRLYSTEQAANDMDAIRAALGESKLNYLGYSYGTLLGAVYAQLFPTKVRAMVLDGAIDPRQSPVASSEGQAIGFERAFTNFATWCTQHRSQCPISADPKRAVTEAIDSARTSPVRGANGREATSGWVFLAVVSSLYSEDAWPYLAKGISDLKGGDPRLIFLLADNYAERDSSGHYTNLFDANNAVNCADSTQYPTVEEIRGLQSQWRAKYPLFGAPLALGLLNCAMWSDNRDPYPVGPATGAPPILVIGTTGDPATPYESTAKLADMLGTGVVVTWQGEGHTAYPETQCIRKIVDNYFVDLTVPAKGVTCPP